MASKRKFYRTVFTVEVLSEEPLPDMSLDEIAYEITEGGSSGDLTRSKSETVDAKKMAKLLMKQGSDPEFFQIDEDGNDIE